MPGFRIGSSTVGGTDTIGGPLNFTIYLDLAGELVASGNIVRPLVSLVKVGVVTSSGGPKFSVAKAMLGAISPAGSPTKSVSRKLLGAITPSGLVSIAAAVDFARMTIEIIDKIAPSLSIIEKIKGVLSIDNDVISIEINGG